ncbi:conserved hypothetical protein (DUF1801) [Formosa agariphila KMM 3901]|uniref:YdhG-like domain-containing protein n=1 Tax=Formosa agariphila (strain DSM 15362 / KCTC 12365 / LMG 23005 / KMM 3901 / M-2Alg 35-1) TaxID=1347342 RepID=T2KGG6_FORAG|nr:DUF1801 domain-containing protein [Formosa agariphila]CDF77845.1 conserved hypothetical protein (DUF1801) [Formosa agariphila KMM 3901]
MTHIAKTPEDYINNLPERRKAPISRLRQVILDHLPSGFQETISYGMIGYVVPHELYPNGYHTNPKLPLPFINIASQKNYIALYHNGIYANEALLKWFTAQYPKHSKYKLDMGRICIRFKKIDDIPYELIGELVTKMTPQQWIITYRNTLR